MMQSAAAPALAEPVETGFVGRGTRQQIEVTMKAVAAGAEASLHEAIHSVGWRRHGFLQRLVSRPRPARATS
jgi:hypothetical protein